MAREAAASASFWLLLPEAIVLIVPVSTVFAVWRAVCAGVGSRVGDRLMLRI